MVNLLCDEVLWLSSPAESRVDQKHSRAFVVSSDTTVDDFHMTKEDCEEAVRTCLEKETNFHDIPYKPNYLRYLESKNLTVARFNSVQWLIKCRSRLNLSLETVFYSVNYLDRFISLNLCNEWKQWMVELLSIACLSIASKFGDTTTNTPTLHEINQINVDDVSEHHYSFEASTIQKMELVILKSFGWRIGCTTSHSYVEMFSHLINLQQVHMIKHVHDLLLIAISDTKLLEFRPSVVALSALRCSLARFHDSTSSILAQYSSLTRFFTQDQKDDLARCDEIMEMQGIGIRSSLCRFAGDYDDDETQNNYKSPSSPTTVLLLREGVNDVCDFHVDLSLFNIIHDYPNTHQTSTKKQRTLSTSPMNSNKMEINI